MVAFAKTRSERLASAHQRAARLRAEAFVDYQPDVCGITLRPITLETFNALDAFGNSFFTGGAITFDDIANFVWIHHPKFGQFSREEKARCTCAVWRWLNPRFSGLNELVWFASSLPRFRWMRRLRRARAIDLQQEAVAEIRRLMHEATHDMPAGETDENGKAVGEPMPYAFQAHLLNFFRRHLGLSFAETRALPLKQLAQHYRETIQDLSRGKAMLLTREEASIWADDLGHKTEAAQKEIADRGNDHA